MYLLLADAIVLLPESLVLLFSSQYQSPYTFIDCLASCNTGIKERCGQHYSHDYHVQYNILMSQNMCTDITQW